MLRPQTIVLLRYENLVVDLWMISCNMLYLVIPLRRTVWINCLLKSNLWYPRTTSQQHNPQAGPPVQIVPCVISWTPKPDSKKDFSKGMHHIAGQVQAAGLHNQESVQECRARYLDASETNEIWQEHTAPKKTTCTDAGDGANSGWQP